MSSYADMHEKIVIQKFIALLKLNKDSEIYYPKDYPDCVIYSNNKNLWLEETSVYSTYHKKTSKVQKDSSELYRKISLYKNPENLDSYLNNTIEKIISRIEEKDKKPNYLANAKKWGCGILLLKIDCPFFNWSTHLDAIKTPKHYAHVNLTMFRSVFLAIYPMYERPLIMPSEKFILLWEK